MLPAYLLHSLVDVDWDYIAVSGPAFLVAGALAGRAGGERRVSGFAVLAAAGAALAAFGALLLPWLGHRWSGEAQAALGQPAHAATLARRARAVDPLLIDPFFTLAFAAEQQGKPTRAYAYYVEATQAAARESRDVAGRGPLRARPGCPRLAYDNLVHFTELDPYAPGADGGDHLQRVVEDRQRRQGAVLAASSADAEDDDQLRAVQRGGAEAVERADDLHVQVAGEPDSLDAHARRGT